MSYLSLGRYGVIGDLHSAAMVGANGSIDWCCLPRFDSPSLFAALLDHERGGRWQIAPSVPHTGEQHYLPGTNILQTVFRAGGGGVVDVTDFMPVGPTRAHRARLYRRIRAARGTVPVRVQWAPRFDYARQTPWLTRRTHGMLATDRDDDVATVSADPATPWQVDGNDAIADLELAEGGEAWFVLTFDDDEVAPLASHAPQETLEATIRWWDAWSSRLQYAGPYRREVERSALALKLCHYEPSGAFVAALTTSLPESLNGQRNWDYRYTWLRDSAFVLYALDVLGYEDETDAFLYFLRRVCRREGDSPLQIMYAVDGVRELPERVLDHLHGYLGLSPVRVGNAAVGQFQLDVYGEVMATLEIWLRRREPTEGTWKVVCDLADGVIARWQRPDFSIWEPRDNPKHHTYSKVMAWTALDRAATIAARYEHPEQEARWRREAALIHAEVLEHGWDAERGTFVQSYGETALDAALLVVPKIRFLPRTDPRVATSLAAIRRELASSCEELIYRYRAPDGLSGDEGTFVFSSFWMVENLAMVGHHAEAERLFRNLLRRFDPLGLAAEEIDPATGEQLGNFPQGLSHASLITAAYVLERLRPPDQSGKP
jgi:GH15 family glucan-1,4-alpha-glucosidase